MTGCPLVFIEWVDSAQPISSWKHLSDFETHTAVKCASVGWLIYDGDDTKAVAPNMGGLENENNVQVSGVIRIPTRCVIKVSYLDEPELTCPEALLSHLDPVQRQQEL